MSAIVIHWINKTAGYEHTALLLNNLGLEQSLYISIYKPLNKDRSSNRFSSQTFEDDIRRNVIANYVVIPTCEDGNKFGLSEGVIAKFWMELFSFKKIPHEKFIAELSTEDMKNLFLNEEDEKLSATDRLAELNTGKKNALTELSSEFEKFSARGFFSRQPVLDCTKFIVKLLQKGGLDLFLDSTLLTGYIGVTEFIDLAEKAKKNIVDIQDQPTLIKNPKLTINTTVETLSQRRLLKH